MVTIKKFIHAALMRMMDRLKQGIEPEFRYNLDIKNDTSILVNINIPANCARLRLDIGLSHNAPNSFNWLENNSDVAVIGIEANRYNVKTLVERIKSKNSEKNKIKERFQLVYCAIDNAKKPGYASFYHVTGDSGTSSLLPPTDELLKRHYYKVREKSNVPVVSLSDILKNIEWGRIEYIEICKIDTQGKDLDVLKSAANYLSKIAIVIAEVNTWGQYEGAASENQITAYMIKNGFSIYRYIYQEKDKASDIVYINESLAEKVKGFLSELD